MAKIQNSSKFTNNILRLDENVAITFPKVTVDDVGSLQMQKRRNHSPRRMRYISGQKNAQSDSSPDRGLESGDD
jgi:hypothetical protein